MRYDFSPRYVGPYKLCRIKVASGIEFMTPQKVRIGRRAYHTRYYVYKRVVATRDGCYVWSWPTWTEAVNWCRRQITLEGNGDGRVSAAE